MNTHYLRRARRLFDHEGVPRHVVRHNMRAWVRSVRHLGNSWLLANPVERKAA
jgi:hypothetical protein